MYTLAVVLYSTFRNSRAPIFIRSFWYCSRCAPFDVWHTNTVKANCNFSLSLRRKFTWIIFVSGLITQSEYGKVNVWLFDDQTGINSQWYRFNSLWKQPQSPKQDPFANGPYCYNKHTMLNFQPFAMSELFLFDTGFQSNSIALCRTRWFMIYADRIGVMLNFHFWHCGFIPTQRKFKRRRVMCFHCSKSAEVLWHGA